MSENDHPFWRLQHALSHILQLKPLDIDAIGVILVAQRALRTNVDARAILDAIAWARSRANV